MSVIAADLRAAYFVAIAAEAEFEAQLVAVFGAAGGPKYLAARYDSTRAGWTPALRTAATAKLAADERMHILAGMARDQA